MTAPVTILIYGRDLSLLETRSWVLERAGYSVCLSQSLDDVARIMTRQRISLLLLCHTLAPEDANEVLQATAKAHPRMRRLLVTAHTAVPPGASDEITVSAFEGPRALVAAVERVLVTEDGPG